VQNATLQVTFEAASDKQNYYLRCRFDCSSQTLNQLIAEGRAAFVTHAECTNTVFRTRFGSAVPEQTHVIAGDRLNGAVEMNFFICATDSNANYRIAGAHADYGDAIFAVGKGDILAVADGRRFDAGKNTESLRRISSIMQIQESPEDGDVPMRLAVEQHKLGIVLSKHDFAEYKLFKLQPQLLPMLTSTIVLPALVEALHTVRGGGETDGNALRWQQNLRTRLETLNAGPDDDVFVIAQQILDLPLRRSLLLAKEVAVNS